MAVIRIKVNLITYASYMIYAAFAVRANELHINFIQQVIFKQACISSTKLDCILLTKLVCVQSAQFACIPLTTLIQQLF